MCEPYYAPEPHGYKKSRTVRWKQAAGVYNTYRLKSLALQWKRPHTLRELACLQGFPLTHIFGQFEIERHIGNAVPPLVMRVLLKHVVEELRERGGISE